MKFDFIYSDAISVIKQKKNDGMNFFSGDSVCLIVSENNVVYTAFNSSALRDGKLVSEPSEKIALKKMTDAGENIAQAMIIMNCSEVIPILPDESFLELVFEINDKNKEMLVVTPDTSYIKLSDAHVYIKDGDNSAIEVEKIDTDKLREKKEETDQMNFDFEAPSDASSSEHQTVYLFAKPGSNSEASQQVLEVNDTEQNNLSNEDISHMYMPINNQGDVRNGMNQQYMNPNGMKQQYMNPNGMNQQYMNPNGMNQQYMNPNGMNQQYMNPNGMNQQYMNPNGMNQQYMNPNGMNQQYINPNGMSPLYMNQQYANTQYINPNGMSPLYMNQQYANTQYINPNGMSPLYMNQQYVNQNYMNQQYMEPNNYMPYGPGVPQQASVYYNTGDNGVQAEENINPEDEEKSE